VGVVFLTGSGDREIWPYPGYDCETRHQEILKALRQGCPGVEFVPVVVHRPDEVKKAIALGKEVRKQPEKTKADAARAMFELISGEPREIVVQAFVDGAGLTPKGAQTYFYNCKRKMKEAGGDTR
jgi:hypothetical protein